MQGEFPLSVDFFPRGVGKKGEFPERKGVSASLRIDPRGGMYVLRLIFQPPDTDQDEKTTS